MPPLHIDDVTGCTHSFLLMPNMNEYISIHIFFEKH